MGGGGGGGAEKGGGEEGVYFVMLSHLYRLIQSRHHKMTILAPVHAPLLPVLKRFVVNDNWD